MMNCRGPNANPINISIVWDFDKTLTLTDSTSELIKIFIGEGVINDFWDKVKKISGVSAQAPVNSVSTSEAPVWMHMLSKIAYDKDDNKPISLTEKGLEKFIGMIKDKIEFYPKVFDCLKGMKDLSLQELYKKNNIHIHHFIITAGLKDLVSIILKFHKKQELFKKIFGCCYKEGITKNNNEIENIPIYCMDKTTKTRSLFEISKGCFLKNSQDKVDDLILDNELWCPFQNMIYIGDGDTDIPAFSLVKARKGMTIGVFNTSNDKTKINKDSQSMREGQRLDFFTPANFEKDGALFKFIKTRCDQIAQRYEARKDITLNN